MYMYMYLYTLAADAEIYTYIQTQTQDAVTRCDSGECATCASDACGVAIDELLATCYVALEPRRRDQELSSPLKS
eukprot:scaffold8453_cov140-Isochrysis_galbana.AAC.2